LFSEFLLLFTASLPGEHISWLWSTICLS